MNNLNETTPAYSIVIPVYNSATGLRELTDRIIRAMENHGVNFELIFIEDCGPDRSWQVLQDIHADDPRVRVEQLLKNSGQGSATLAGISLAQGDFIITMDDDLQNPPEEIIKLIDAMNQNDNIDVVMGVPLIKNHNFFRRLCSSAIHRLNSLILKKDPSLRTTSFRIMRRQVATCLLSMNMPFPSLGPMIFSITRRISNVTVEHHPRASGQSGYTLRTLLRQTLSNIIGYSALPLHLLSVIGAVGIVACTIITGYFLYRYFTVGINVPGWTTLLVVIMVLSSFNFFAFSLIGEYLLRISKTSMASTQWIIRTSGKPDSQLSLSEYAKKNVAANSPKNHQ